MRVKDIVDKMNIGVSKQTLGAELSSPLHILLKGVHQEVIDRLNSSIDKYDIKASNRLKQSIISVDKSQKGTISIAISAEFYWKYVQYGTGKQKVTPPGGLPSTWGQKPAGTPSFKEAILGWIRDKGLKARPGQTYESMAFAIMKGIKEKGTKPRPFFTDVVNDELKEYLAKSISDVYKEAIRIEIIEPWQ